MKAVSVKRVLAIALTICFALSLHWCSGRYWHLSSAQEAAIGITILASFLWITELVPLFIVSFIILGLNIVLLSPLLKQPHQLNIFFQPFFSNIILLFLGGFVISKLFQIYKFDKQLARTLLQLSKGRPLGVLIAVILMSTTLSMWMSNTATAAVVITLLLPICEQLDEQEPFRKALFLAVPFSCNIGGFGTPIGSPPNAIALAALNKMGILVGFIDWVLWAIPIVLVLGLVICLLLYKMFKPKFSSLDISAVDNTSIIWTRKSWLALGIIVLTILGWMFSSTIGVSSGTISLIPIVMAFALKILDESEFRRLPWDVLFMVGGGVSLGVAIQVTNLSEILLNSLGEVPISPVILLLSISFMVMLISTFMSNTATAGIVMPLIGGLSIGGISTEVAVLMVTLGCSLAMALPISTPPNSIAFSSGILKPSDMLRAGSLTAVIGVIVVGFLGFLYWQAII